MPSLTVSSSGTLRGTFSPPGDKSISHRAVMFGALSDGESRYDHFLEAADCLHTLQAFQSLGVQIQHTIGTGKVVIRGAGMRGLKQPAGEIDLGNSGTSIRLMLGILSGQRLEATLSGDASLQSRPMKRVTQPLKKMGAQIKGREDGNFAPLWIRGGKLKALEFDNALSSAQVKSAILFAGLQADGVTRVIEKLPSRDHTEKFLIASGAPFKKEGPVLSIQKTDRLKSLSGTIPGDPSAAAFFVAAAAMTPGSELTVEQVCLNPTRIGFLEVLNRMGAQINIEQTAEIPEAMGRIHVKGSRLKGTRVTPAEIPSLIDELPILMIVMAVAEGESLVSGAAELRVKETDRIHSMVLNLKAVGARAEELPDGVLIVGVERLKGGKIQSFWDHRTAMSFAVASMVMDGEVEIDDISCVSTSFPLFFSEFKRLQTR